MSDEARAEAERLTMHTEDRGRSEWLFVAGAEWQASRPVSDAEVEAAAQVLYEQRPVVSYVNGPIPWDDPEFESWTQREVYLNRARASLEAARRVPVPKEANQ